VQLPGVPSPTTFVLADVSTRATGGVHTGGGAAVYYVGGEVIAIDSTFVDNVAAIEGPDVAGGAVYAIGRGGFTAVGCSFAGNRASNGGAIGILGGPLTIVNSVLDGNEATGHGANYIDQNGMQQGRGGNGGACSMDGQGQDLVVCGSQFRNNVARAFGGAIGRTSYESEPSVIQRSWFDANVVLEDPDPMVSTGAGALYLQGSTVTMDAVTVSNNQARGSAGVWILGHGLVLAFAHWPELHARTRVNHHVMASVAVQHETAF